MTLAVEGLGSFGDLAKAVGLVDASGNPNSSWFGDPLGASGNQNGLSHLLADDGQRTALLSFADEVLGPPDRAQRAGRTWVPLFAENDPKVTVFAVVEEAAGQVRLGVGLEHTTSGGPPTVSTRLHVPLLRVARRDGPALPDSDGLPGWLMLGRPGGRVEISVDAVFRNTPPAAGEASLGGVTATIGIPTAGADDLGIAFELRDLQLPGTPAPRTFSLDADSLAELGTDVLDLLAGLVRAQAEALDLTQPALRPFAALAGMLGLRDVPNLPPFPLSALPTQGVNALVDWVQGILLDDPALDAWLGQLANLVGGMPDPANNAVTVTIGPMRVAVGLRVQPGTGGHPILLPFAEVSMDTRTGVRARLRADLLRADTGTGAVTALPDVRLEAVFGAEAGGSALLPGPDPRVGSLRTGISLDGTGRPAFVLTLHDVTVAGRTHPLLDLSSPEAAVESASSVIEGALATAIAQLGAAGALVNRLIGLDPPAGVSGLDVTDLLADPLAEVMRYWRALTASPAAAADVLGRLRALISGAAVGSVPGTGSRETPWRVVLVGEVALQVWRDGDVLTIDLGWAARTPVLTDYEASAGVALTLLRLDLAAARATFAAEASGRLSLARADGQPAALTLGSVGIEARSLSFVAGWAAGRGLRAALDADGLAVTVAGSPGQPALATRVALTLPTLDTSGRLTLPTPDWTALERVFAGLLGELRLPVLDAMVDLVGWRGTGPHLDLAVLLTGDPLAAVREWLADLILDCDRTRAALGPVAALLSGFRLSEPFGSGNARSPFRCPVAGQPELPGLAVWLDPGCPPSRRVVPVLLSVLNGHEPPETATVVGTLREAALDLPDLAELLVGRDSLVQGFDGLLTRWRDTDGLTGRPTTLPDRVNGVTLEALTYAELVALGSTGMLLGDLFETVPAAVVHVGCEPTWATGRAAGTAFDQSAAVPPGPPQSVPATGDGAWYVRLPTPAVAAAARPDRGAVGEQAARLASVLSGRTGPVTVVAYGPAGAAALRAASTLPAVATVITVGTPWSDVAADSLRSGLSGDALRLLDRLRRPGQSPMPDPLMAQEITPGEQARTLIQRSLGFVTGAEQLPSAATETLRAGLEVHAVFGHLDEDTLARALGFGVADGILHRIESARTEMATGGEPVALHAGIDLPVIDLDLDGLLVGAGFTIELCRIGRATTGPGLSASVVRGVHVDLHLGVHDGWLVGGPGSTGGSGDLRWMSARVEVPLDGRPGTAELVLHEARGLGVDRERWVVRADSAAVPEVRVLLADVTARLRAASPHLAALLDLLGLARDRGLDPDGLDRLLHDTAATMRAAVNAAPAALAAALRGLIPAATGSGSAIGWTAGPATISLDLASGAVGAGVTLATAGLPPLEIAVSANGGTVSASVGIGAIDPIGGGVKFVARTAPAPWAGFEWAAPNATMRSVTLLPAPDVTGLRDFAVVALPASLAHSLVIVLRNLVSSAARSALDGALDAVGLLAAPDSRGTRSVVFPLALFQDPGAWLRHGIEAWRTNTASRAVALLDALAPLVVPSRGGATGWPLAEGVVIGYTAESGNRLRLVADVTLAVPAGTATVTTHVIGGLLIGPDGLPSPTIEASVDIDGRGLRLTVGAPSPAPPVQLSLIRPAPSTELPLYPSGPGLGQALSAIGETVLPPVLNAIAGHRTDPPSLLRDVGQAVHALGGALDLLESNQFTGARIATFATDPSGRLLNRLPMLVSAAAAALADALDPTHAIVTVGPPSGNRVTFGFGSGTPVQIVLDASGSIPAIEIRANVLINGVGRFRLDRLRLSAQGVEVAAEVGPILLNLGAFSLRPLLIVRAGSAAGSTRLLGLGLALDDTAQRSVQVRWALNATPPALTPITRTSTGETLGTETEAAQWLLALALSLAGGVVVQGLESVLTTRAVDCLRGVVFTDAPASRQIDPAFALDLLNPPALLERLKRLLWNAAQSPGLSLTLGGVVTIGLAANDIGGGRRALGLHVSLVPGRKFKIAEEDTRVELEVDATWVHPTVAAGLGIYVLEGASAAALTIAPSVSIAGLGVRFTKTSGPLLSLGAIALDGIAIHIYGEVTSSGGIGGGVNLELAGLAFSPGGGGGNNGVANSIMNDAGKAGPASRPVFSPSLAVQKHPGMDPTISVRAGRPPGPWWLVIQRQLGPLYLERVGFNSVETNGTVTQISLLFDGKVSIFGLTAAVDQLSLNWLGGDILDIGNWSVDLMGLAISADMSGVSLAGGILKTIGPPPDQTVSYVGMLMGRFGVYGLSVFGGYTNDNGSPSFFVFGGINGPIGGPPAFFITGIGGGLGINRGLRIPDDPSRFNEFPFIQALDPAAQAPTDPMAELRRLNVYFPVQRGNFWFAAGISFNSFTLVDGIAVIAVSFGDGLEINLMGLARMALPRPQAALVSIELGLLARFSTREGVFMVRAALTENSWLLYPEVRLTGGFAFVIWWKGPLAGQFVMTLGGYHPDFHREGYPDVPRLGLIWQVTDNIVIKGGSYFALTSEALMTGVDIEASADFGWAWAKVAFGAHGIVYFDPFWFEVTIYARISAGIKIKTFFGTIRISISIGGRITVWGPEFSGRASFEVGPCDLSVSFGSERSVEARTLSWTEFVTKYLEDTGSGTARAMSSITGRGTLPSATGGDRSAPTADGSSDRPFEVFAEFELTVVTTIPVTKLDAALPSGTMNLPVVRTDGLIARPGLKPMAAGDLEATLRIRLQKKESGGYVDLPAQLALLTANIAAATPRPEGSGLTQQAFPVGTWGAPELPGVLAPLPQGDVLNATSTVRLVAEAVSLHRGPEIDYYRVEATRRPLPLQAGGTARVTIIGESATVSLPRPATANDALTAAENRLFAQSTTTVPDGLLATGQRSALSRASYRGQVSAPPLFGTLADGIAPANAGDAPARRTPAPPVKSRRENRLPTIAGYLSSGTGVAKRAPRTTVKDGEPMRRPAPTLDSVRARLGAELPISLRLTELPAIEQSKTVVGLTTPRTGLPGTERSYSTASAATKDLIAGLDSGFSASRARDSAAAGARAAQRTLASGDIVVLAMPDASVDTAKLRPRLGIEGRARVVAMRGDGEVVHDAVADAPVPIAAGAALVAVQADGTVDTGDGFAGWHSRSRVCTLGTHAALGAGCVLTVAGRPTTPKGTVWTTAGELLIDAASSVTRFSRPVRTVALVVESAAGERLDGLGLDLIGARRARGVDRAELPPTVVLSGSQAVVVYTVEPDREGSAVDGPPGAGSDTGPPGAGSDTGPLGAGSDTIAVRVRSGGDWLVTGVLGGTLDQTRFAQAVARQGVAAMTGRLLAAEGPGCRLSWEG